MTPHKIFLVGLPGTGKSHFGKELSDKLDIPFIDLDKAIEEKEKCTISEIFSNEGEEQFRLVESQMLKEVINKYDKFVLATGGGTPCYYKGMALMSQDGTVVHLEIDDAVLEERLNDSEERPLILSDVSKTIRDLREKRDPIYQKAHVTLLDRDIDGLLEKISALEI